MSTSSKNRIYMHFRQTLLSPSAKLKMLLSDLSLASVRYAEAVAFITEAVINGSPITGQNGVISISVPDVATNDGAKRAYPVMFSVTEVANGLINNEWVKGYKLTPTTVEREVYYDPEDLMNRISMESFSVECFNAAIIASTAQAQNISDTIAIFESSVNKVPEATDISALWDIFNGFKTTLINAINAGSDVLNTVLSYAGSTILDVVNSQDIDVSGLPFESSAMAYAGYSPIGMWFTNIREALASLDWSGFVESAVSTFLASAGSVMSAIILGGLRFVQLTNAAFTAIESVFTGKNISLSSHGYEDFSVAPGIVKWSLSSTEVTQSGIGRALAGHDDSYLVIPTLGCTVYVWKQPGTVVYYMGYRPHLYNQDFSTSIYSIVSRTGNTFETLESYLQDMPLPTFIPYNGQRGNAIAVDNVQNALAMMHSQRLIPLGLMLLNPDIDDIDNIAYQDPNDPSAYRDRYVTFKDLSEYNDTTLWTNSRMLQCVTTVPSTTAARSMLYRAICGALSENDFTGNGHTNLQYALIDEPFSSMWVVPTDATNADEASQVVGTLGKIALAVVIAAGVYVAVRYFCKVRSLARRAAATYYALSVSSADLATVNSAYRKAKLLSVVTGIPINSTIINSSNIAQRLISGFSSANDKENTTHFKIWELSESLSATETDINDNISDTQQALSDIINNTKDELNTLLNDIKDRIG